MGIMTDRQFEEFLRNAAQEYNRPPEIAPREKIWAEIDEARSGGWQRGQWRGEAPWWSWSRGIAATIALWAFPLTAVAGGAALAINRWAHHSEHELPSITVEPRHGQDQVQVQDGECVDTDARVAALNALLQMETKQAMPILMDVLERRDACSVELRRRAVFLVSQHETGETDDILLRVALDDPDEEVRNQAVFWLGQLSSDEAVTALESLLKDARDIELQKKVVFSLSQQGSTRAMRILRDLALDSKAHQEVREQAIFWLGEEGTSDDVSALIDLYDKLDSDALKEKVIFAVSQNSDDHGFDWLLDVARDDNEPIELRKNALFWAGQEGDVDPAKIGAIYDAAVNAELKEHAIFVLSQMDDRDAVSRLMTIARNERNKELRDKAIFWLGQSDDPRAAEFLRELINRPNR
jgi:HEAT repeat protein